MAEPLEEVKPDESGKFSADYVHTLREENKTRRLREKEYEDKFKDIETKFTTLKTEVDSKTSKELEEQNKFKELYEATKSENESLKVKVSDFDGISEKLTKIEQERKDELLAQLTDKHKEFAKDLPLDKLAAYVKLHKDTKTGVDGGRSGGLAFVQDGKKWDDYTDKEKIEISENSPDLYAKLKKEKYKS